jgi:hypothetical protein
LFTVRIGLLRSLATEIPRDPAGVLPASTVAAPAE